jgi:hypothetical protein
MWRRRLFDAGAKGRIGGEAWRFVMGGPDEPAPSSYRTRSAIHAAHGQLSEISGQSAAAHTLDVPNQTDALRQMSASQPPLEAAIFKFVS